MTLARRIRDLRIAFHFDRYLQEHGQDAAYDRHMLQQELEFDRSRGLRTIAPNDLGLRLMLLWMTVKYRAYCLRYLVTGADPHFHFSGDSYPNRY